MKKTTTKNHRMIEETPHHFIMEHPSGESFTIAKAPLDPEHVERIRGMKVEKMYEGGEVPSPAPSPNEIPDQALEAPVPQAEPTPVPVPTGDPAPSSELETPPAAPAAPAPAQVTGSVAAPQSVASRAAAAADPNDPMGLMRRAFTEERAGALGEAKAIGSQGQESSKVLTDLAAQQAKFQQDYAAKSADYAKQRDELEKNYREGKIDPNRYWSSLSTGNRVLAGISLFMGGLAGGFNGRGGNVALDVIQKAIDRDIDAQKTNLDKQHNLLRFNLEKTHDLAQATLATQNQLLSAAKVQVEATAAKYQGPIAAARAQTMIGAITEKQAAIEQQMAAWHAKSQAYSGGGSREGGTTVKDESALMMMDPEYRKARVVVRAPGQPDRAYVTNSEKEGEDMRTTEAQAGPIMDAIRQLDELGPSATIPGTHENRIATALRARLSLAIPMFQGSIAGVKRINDAAIDAAKEEVDNPEKFSSLMHHGVKNAQFFKTLENELESARAAKLIGYKRSNRPKTEKPGFE